MLWTAWQCQWVQEPRDVEVAKVVEAVQRERERR
jgi:hypothetical protein